MEHEMNRKEIYQKLLERCPINKRNIHYLDRYHKFIFNCIDNNDGLDFKSEKHHILPKIMYPDYESLSENSWNTAILSRRQHFISHWLLARAFDNRSMWCSFKFMSVVMGRNITSRVYDEIRENVSLKMSGKNNPMFGMCGELSPVYGKPRIHSDQTKLKMSISKKGKSIHSEEWKRHMSEVFSGNGNPQYGKTGELSTRYGTKRPHTDDEKYKISKKSKEYWSDHENRNKRSIDYKSKGIKPPSQKGKTWWNNGINSTLSVEKPEGYVKGRLKKAL